MAITARIGYAPPGLLTGPRTQFVYLRDEQEISCMHCQAGLGSGSRYSFGAVSRSGRSNRSCGMTSFSDRHPFGTSLEHSLTIHRRQEWKTKVQVAADYPDSKPDASSFLGDLGYHPLEEISNFEKKKSIEHSERRLTDAEVARTLAEVNQNAIIYASVVSDEDHVFGTEVQYLVDEHGDFYFQIDDDSEFLTTLNTAGTYMRVAVGYGSIEDWILEHQEVQEESIVEEAENSSSNEEDDEDEEGWVRLPSEDIELVLVELDEDSSESIGDWAGLDTLRFVHPIDFAERLAEAASADHVEKIEKPSKSLKIVGEVRRLDEDEENYVQRIWYDRFRWEAEAEEDSEEIEQSIDQVEVLTGQQENISSSGASTASIKEISTSSTKELKSEASNEIVGWSLDPSRKVVLPQSEAGIQRLEQICDEEDPVLVPREDTDTTSLEGSVENEELVEAAEFTEVGTSFYKLEMKSIHLVSGFGAQSSVDGFEFQQAKPDALAHSADAIIERLNARGKTTEDALKALCRHRKGLQVEEVALIELDSLGMDLRVHCGREVQTVRISFSQRATSVENAEQLLNQLLYPRNRHRGRRRRRSRSQRNSL